MQTSLATVILSIAYRISPIARVTASCPTNQSATGVTTLKVQVRCALPHNSRQSSESRYRQEGDYSMRLFVSCEILQVTSHESRVTSFKSRVEPRDCRICKVRLEIIDKIADSQSLYEAH